MRALLIVATLACLAGGCLRTTAFHCASNAQCGAGICEDTGFCSFTDSSCPSGQRYDQLGGANSNQCVDPNVMPLDAAIDSATHDGSPATAPAGAVMHLAFDDDPTDGVLDSAGAHVVTCVGTCPAVVAGKYGSAYQFTGTQMLTTPNVADLAPSSFTFAAWAQINGAPSQYGNIACKQYSTTEASYCLTFNSTKHMDFYTDGGNPTTHDLVNATAADATWHHYAFVYTAASKKGYIDGALVASGAAGYLTSTNDFVIGALTTTSYQLDGLIDDLYYYDRALSAAEVQQLMVAH